jgi:hypothetical protein
LNLEIEGVVEAGCKVRGDLAVAAEGGVERAVAVVAGNGEAWISPNQLAVPAATILPSAASPTSSA